jgi:N-acetyltransferase
VSRAGGPLRPIVLEGDFVRLEPMTLEHHAGLSAVGLDPEIWRFTLVVVQTTEEMRRYIDAALELQRGGTALPFVTIERSSGRIVGSTRFGNYDPANRRIEIGWTWLARPWQRTAVNTEAKYLMLTHAFDVWEVHRVALKTDERNARSRRAIERLGAKLDGVRRADMPGQDGSVRSSAYYSIVRAEWPAVRATLEQSLADKPW